MEGLARAQLLGMLKTIALPCVAFEVPAASVDRIRPSVFTNGALHELLKGSDFLNCLDEQSRTRLVGVLADEAGEAVELHLQVQNDHQIIRWNLNRPIQHLVILTAIPTSSSFDRSTEAKSADAKKQANGTAKPFVDVWKAPTQSKNDPISTAPIFDRPPSGSPFTLEHFARLATDVPIGLLFCNLQLEVLWVNRSWCQLVGLSLDEDPNGWPRKIHPEDRERVLTYAGRMVTDLKPMEIEFRWETKDQDDKGESWCVNYLEVARDVEGTPIGIIGALYNVDKQKSKELRDLRDREHERESMLGLERDLAIMSKLSSVGLSRMDLDGHVLEVNEAWWNIVKLPRDRPLDEWTTLVHPTEVEAKKELWENLLKKMESAELTVRWADDTVSLVQVHPNHPDKATGWVCSLTDITTKARAEEALLALSAEREADARKAAEEAEARKEVVFEEKRQQELFLDIVMHEMRNPISGIQQNAEMTRSSLQDLRRTFVKLLASGTLPADFSPQVVEMLDEDVEAIDSIHSCSLAQERIANDILGLAQIQLSKFKISLVEFDLPQSLRNIVRVFKTEARSKGIEIILELGKSISRLGPHARVIADPARLAQCLSNLLSNAMRFTQHSEVRKITLAVEVSAVPPNRAGPFVPPDQTEYQVDRSRPVYLFFCVTDTGTGMTKDEQAQLFSEKPFFYTSGGTGLGLWIVRNLVQLQAGGVEVESEPGKGSIFRAFITARSVDAGLPPEESAAAVPVIEGVKNPSGQGSAPKAILSKTSEAMPLRGMTILCCEDNMVNRKVLERQLKKEGADQVILAVDGQEGLNALEKDEKRKIDCCIMDVEMPVMDGLTATRSIRAKEKELGLVRLRIVGLSGNARPAQVKAGMDSGMDSFVTKPYRVPDLVRKLLGEEREEQQYSRSDDPTPFASA